ncbi:hypothetical protein JGH11_02240 [Dysgonomonas sp. Marseille-P4677]|uniref:YfhO family protein n=1 Tax=Dysgonomonas sp. Marseille-P4677 TaxID=2364790 RepID=UPI001911C102|nr:YfhO family protein [Dysgonomonas sp. Marseille-P4677]MBK5719685.1 hypothetical protein [Dysgonomonas sp. Marseille-P4677]
MNKIDEIIHTVAENKKYHFCLFLATLILLAICMVLIYGPAYEHPGYDYYFHLKRFEALITAFREGTFPIYIDHMAALNYGYLSKVFYSDIILIPFAALGTLISPCEAYEVMLFTMTILCGLFMYWAVNIVYKSSYVAFLASILYTFSVYRLFDVYNRGALGEVFAFTFIPLVFLGLYHIIKGDYKKWYIIAIGFSLLIFSHVISTVLTFITVVLILIFYYKSFIKEPRRIYFLVLAGFITLLITTVYIYPLLEQMLANSYRYETNDWTLPSRSKIPLLYVFWGLICGFFYPKDISIVGIGILLTAVIFLRFFVKEKSNMLRSVDIGVLIGLFYIFASSQLFPWGRFPFTLLSFIQYPGRLYLLVTLFLALAGGYYLSRIFMKERSRFIVAVIVVLCSGITLYTHNGNFRQKHIDIHKTNKEPNPSNFFYLNGAEYVPDRMESAYHILFRGDSIIGLGGHVHVLEYHRDRGHLNIDIEVQDSDSLELPLLYYKGYVAKLEKEELAITQSKRGLIQIPVDKSGSVKVYYKGTIIQKVSYYISILSIFVLCIYIFLQKRRKPSKK